MSTILEKCHLNNISFIGSSSIRGRILFGFGMIIAVLLIVSLSTLDRFVNLSNGISDVTEEIQPVVLTAQNLETRLEAIGNALGFYLLTKNNDYKDTYLSHLEGASQLTVELGGYDFVMNNDAYRTAIENVSANLQKLSIYKSRMTELVGSDVENIPALKISVEKSNPLAQQSQAMISQGIESALEEESEDGKKRDYSKAM